MIIICLDQCAISELAKAALAKNSMGELRKILLEAAQELKLICPVASETIVETTGLKSAEQRIEIYELHSQLADPHAVGPLLAFKNIWKMIDEETLALARSQAPPSAFEFFRWRRVDDDKLAADTWRGVIEGKQRMLERVRAHELAHPGRPTIELTKKSAALATEHASHIYRQLERLLAGEGPDKSDHMGYELAVYLRQQDITRTELEKLKQDIVHHRWEAIPVIFNRTQLTARLEADFHQTNSPRSYDVNDEFDIPRLSVGLSSADVIITDSAMAQLCRTVKTDTWSSAKVFAIRDADKILAYFEAVLGKT
jgi:hypothetical protein